MFVPSPVKFTRTFLSVINLASDGDPFIYMYEGEREVGGERGREGRKTERGREGGGDRLTSRVGKGPRTSRYNVMKAYQIWTQN